MIDDDPLHLAGVEEKLALMMTNRMNDIQCHTGTRTHDTIGGV